MKNMRESLRSIGHGSVDVTVARRSLDEIQIRGCASLA